MSYPLYGGLPPHEKEPVTSVLAAVAIAPHVETLQERIYKLVAGRGDQGATVDEIEAELGMLHQTASARARELVQLGKLRHAGFTRRTRSGRRAMVHVRADIGGKQEALFG